MKLVIMTKSTFFVEEDKILTALFDEGMDILHLSKSDSSPLYSERLLTLLPDDYHRKITVHEHYYLKNEFGLAGIHINDMNTETPKGYHGHIGRTCTNTARLKEMKKKADYVFLRNIFNSKSNSDEQSTFTMSQLEEAASQGLIDRKVYALGGMDIDAIRTARELGFGGVVISGDLWNRFDIHNETDFKAVINEFVRLRRTVG